MSDKDNKTDKVFNQSFEDFEITPSDTIWDNVKNKLDSDTLMEKTVKNAFEDYQVTPSKRVWATITKELDKERYKRRAIWFQRIAAGLLLFITAAGIFTWRQYNSKDKQRMADQHPFYSENSGNTLKNQTKKPKELDIPVFSNKKKRDEVDKSTILNRIGFSRKQSTSPPPIITASTLSLQSTDGPLSYKSGTTNTGKSLIDPPSIMDNNPVFASDSKKVMGEKNFLINGNDPVRVENKEALTEVNDGTHSPFTSDTVSTENSKISNSVTTDQEPATTESRTENSVPNTQSTTEKAPRTDDERPSKWVIGMVGSPDYSFRKLSANTTPNTSSKEDIDQLNRNEKGKYTYTAGFKLGRKWARKWQLNMGLQYSTKGYITNGFRIDSVAPSMVLPSTTSSSNGSYSGGYVPEKAFGDSIGTNAMGYTIYRYNYYLNHKIQYVEIPVTLQYSLMSWKKLQVNISAGASINYLYRSKLNAHFTSSKQGELLVYNGPSAIIYKRIYYSGVVNMNVDYQLFKNIHLETGAIYRRALTPMNQSAAIHILPFSWGWNIGVYYHF